MCMAGEGGGIPETQQNWGQQGERNSAPISWKHEEVKMRRCTGEVWSHRALRWGDVRYAVSWPCPLGSDDLA